MDEREQQKLDNLRHSCAHLLAAAVMELYPNTKPTLGPPIDTGFYYDFDFGEVKVSTDDLHAIEEKMRELVKDWKEFSREEVSKEQALERYDGNEYKQELINQFANEGQTLTLYTAGNFTDLCRGGHCLRPYKELKHFKLLNVAGAYWRGDENNPMLTRIYGTCFAKAAELEAYLNQLEEAKKRDHRKIGKEMELFSFSEYVGGGLPLYAPKGALIRRLLNDYIEEEQVALGYEQVWTPQIAKASLFQKSGHYDKYKDDMFRVHSNYSDEEFYLKPMNCPQHTQIYASQMRSYRDLPIRYADFAMLYRDEKPGELNGLARVRGFSTDDTHIFCREDQVDGEIDAMLQMTKKVMKTFGFSYRYRLSTRDPDNKDKYFGDPKVWDKVEQWAVEIMERNQIKYYDGPGEAAFYAPKMDLMATDALGREWQLSTVQIDYVQPARFELKYVGENGELQTPVMIHRAVLGSSERFMMVMIEHFGGAFPTWLSPVQVKVLPITDDQIEYARLIAGKLRDSNVRVEVDDRSQTLNAKIRDAQMEKVPYMLVVGGQEEEKGTVTVRTRSGNQVRDMAIELFTEQLVTEVQQRNLELSIGA